MSAFSGGPAADVSRFLTREEHPAPALVTSGAAPRLGSLVVPATGAKLRCPHGPPNALEPFPVFFRFVFERVWVHFRQILSIFFDN